MMNSLYKVLQYRPDDARLTVNRHTNTVFPITRFSSQEEVDRRREELRFNLRMAAGLYPWPEKTPLNTKIEDAGKFDGYIIKKIMFESRPGFWSTGNLYLPDPLPEKAPAILNVIGHWSRQRLTREDTADYPQQLANFARMGFICLVTDMIGMVDSRQLDHNYGLSAAQESWLSNGLGIQLWNNIRALDLLCSMPEVDANNIGMTGASGGGSQTLFLALLDDRIKAAAPINMISLNMQGGCPCENAPGLRRCTDNTEMCALIAPRPLFLAGSDGDWTRYLQSSELPAVLEAYRQYNAEDMVEHFYQIAPHQYNDKTRHRVYNFFARHLMGKDICWNEQPIETEDLLDFTFFRDQGKAPGYTNDDEFFAGHIAERQAAIAALSQDEKKKMLAWIMGIGKNSAHMIPISTEKNGDVTIERGLLYGQKGEKLPTVLLKGANWDGKRLCALPDRESLDHPDIKRMLADGIAIFSADVFLAGEFSGAVRQIIGNATDNRFFTTFNYPDDALRVQDTALLLQSALSLCDEVTVWAEGNSAIYAACALPLFPAIKSARLSGVSPESTLSIPGISLLGGAEGCLSLAECPIERFD